jgi:serine/threonine protein kinase
VAQQTYTKTITYIPIPGSWERRAYPSRPQYTPRELKPGEISYITKGKQIGWGGTARLERLPSGDVVKTPLPDPDRRCFEAHCQDMRLEARIYDAVGLHPRIPRIVSWDPKTCCLAMEYLENGMMKDYITTNSESLTPQLRQRWAKQASEGLSVLHAAGVIHCDISPRNFLLDGDLHLKIADFGGGSLAGSAASAVAGTRFRFPVSDWDAPPRFEEDVFGLGSLIYFIMTDAYPYKDVPSHEVEELYGSRTFPDVTEIACGDIITRCWGMQVSAAEVHAYFEALDG